MSKLTRLIKTIAKESWQLNEIGGGLGAKPKPPTAPQQWTPPAPAVSPAPPNSMGPGRSAAGPAPSRGPSPDQQRSNYSASVANAPTPNLNAVERGQRVNSMGPTAGSAGVAAIPKPPVAPVMGSTNNIGAPGSKLANKAAGVPNRSASTQVAGTSTSRPMKTSPVTVNPVQQTHSTQAPVEPVKAAPGTSSSQKAVTNRPAQRMSKPVQNRLPRKPKAPMTTANQDTMSNLTRGMNEEKVPVQVKESFEKFLRNNFLVG